jgi:hypothetical protein
MKIAGEDVETRLSPLTPDTLKTFIHIERPSGPLTAAYGRCVTTLEQMLTTKPALKNAFELAVRIDGDGVDHFERFNTVKRNLESYGDSRGLFPYLRQVKEAKGGEAENALALFNRVRICIAEAYIAEAAANPDYAVVQARIKRARETMREFQAEAEALAKKNLGVPLLDAENPLRLPPMAKSNVKLHPPL